MSRTPHPVAILASILTHRAMVGQARALEGAGGELHVNLHALAILASDLHRLAKGCSRQAVAECNGEFYDGQREYHDCRGSAAELDDQIAEAGTRLDKRIVKLNITGLAALSIEAHRTGDPRGFTLRLRSTDPAWPMPSNGMEQGEWGIA